MTTSIISDCPCCGSSLLVDLSTGDLFADGDQVQKPRSHYSSGITVEHATEGWNTYVDPSHVNGKPILQPPQRRQEEQDERPPIPPPTEEDIKLIGELNRKDWIKRGIYYDQH